MTNSAVDVRKAWRDARLVPLWESPTAHKPPPPPDPVLHWSWERIRPLLSEAMKVTSPEAVERRVLSLVSSTPRTPEDEATVRTISAAIQMLLPGERARPHRHTINALRFVLEGSGATTLVDGKACPMEVGDLILTPGWTWHEHHHAGQEPMIWLDVLDVPLHLWLGTVVFQPGPVNDSPKTVPDAAYASPNILPVVDGFSSPHSPVFRYPYATAVASLSGAPPCADGSRTVRYSNPLSGRGAINLLDMTLMELSPDGWTRDIKSNINVVCCVVEGEGESIVGDTTIRWRPRDVFTIPQLNVVRHRALKSPSRLFMVSDRDVLERLGLLMETLG